MTCQMTVPASILFHRSLLWPCSEKYIYVVFLEMIQVKNNDVLFLCNSSNWFCFGSAIVGSVSCSAMTTPNSGCNVALS